MCPTGQGQSVLSGKFICENGHPFFLLEGLNMSEAFKNHYREVNIAKFAIGIACLDQHDHVKA